MTDSASLRWMGEHANDDRDFSIPGMLGSISLTAVRGVDIHDFLVRLGADRNDFQCNHPYSQRYRDVAELADKTNTNVAMHGTCRDWGYIIEDGPLSTFHTRLPSNPSGLIIAGEEIICVALNHYNPPSNLIYAPGDGTSWKSEFCEDPLSVRPGQEDQTRRVAALADALRETGAIWPSYAELGDDRWVEYAEEHRDELKPAVYEAVGRYFGLSIDRHAVEAGALPLVILPNPL